MNKPTTPPRSKLPHHQLIAYARAVELLQAVLAAGVRDAKLRDEASRAAKGAALNTAEGAARLSRADKKRAYAIARAKAAETTAAIEIALAIGDISAEHAEPCIRLGNEVYALLSGLVR